jgi:hypothetical protein
MRGQLPPKSPPVGTRNDSVPDGSPEAQTPPLADRFAFGVASLDYGPVLPLMPFGRSLTVTPLRFP